MTFPLYGESYGALAAQQQNYDQQANAINAANRAAVVQAADREAEMAFRAREMANRDALSAAQQQESRFRFGVERALQERSRADQLAAQRDQLQERRFQFGKQLEQDKARLDLEKARLAETDSGAADEEAMLYSEQLERIREEAERASGVRQELATHLERLNSGRANAVNPQKAAETIAAISKELAAAAKNEAKAKSQLDRALTTFETRGLRGGFKVDRVGNRIITPGGGEYSFGPTVQAPAAQALPVLTTVGSLNNWNGQNIPPPGVRNAQRVRSDIGSETPPDNRQEFALPPTRTAAQVRFDIPAPTPSQPRYTGFIPAASRAAERGLGGIQSGLRGLANVYGVWPARAAAGAIPAMSKTALGAGRSISDFLIMPPEGSLEYEQLMAERANQDRRMGRVRESFEQFAPAYLE